MRLPLARPLAAITRQPHRPVAFALGMVLPLVITGLVLALRIGGLSDSPVDTRPPAYTIPVE